MSGTGSVDSAFEDLTVVRSLEQLAHSSLPIGSLALGPAMGRDELVAQMQSGSWGGRNFAAAPTGIVTIPDTARLGTYSGVVPQLRRRLRLTDLIPTQPMEGKLTSGCPPGVTSPACKDAGVASLADADLHLKLSASESQLQLANTQRRLLALRLQAGGLIGGRLGPPLCVLFEGWDASGKGGCIRRLVSPLDPRHVRVTQFGAPSSDERRHHFLHRFSAALPGWGGMAVLDRSWYGRVLVERVEGLASEAEWRRAYPQIVQWETGLAAEGLVLVKFWLHISEDEQLRRFRARERDPLKRWKLTGEDWRNLSHRADYEEAAEEMLATTDHLAARWHVVAGESKPYARLKVLEIVIAALEDGLRSVGQEPVQAEAAL